MDVLAFQRSWIDASRQKERSAYAALDRAEPGPVGGWMAAAAWLSTPPLVRSVAGRS